MKRIFSIARMSVLLLLVSIIGKILFIIPGPDQSHASGDADNDPCEKDSTETRAGSFEMVDITTYAQSLTDKGTPVISAEKKGNVLARPALEGEIIEVWTQDGNLETRETARRGDMVLTYADEMGQPVLDDYGHCNSWLVSEDTFSSKYDKAHPDPETGVYHPLGNVQTFIEIDKDISFYAPWGEIQNIRKGGYLNITDPRNIYGIAYQEFQETYQVRKGQE